MRDVESVYDVELDEVRDIQHSKTANRDGFDPLKEVFLVANMYLYSQAVVFSKGPTMSILQALNGPKFGQLPYELSVVWYTWHIFTSSMQSLVMVGQ